MGESTESGKLEAVAGARSYSLPKQPQSCYYIPHCPIPYVRARGLFLHVVPLGGSDEHEHSRLESDLSFILVGSEVLEDMGHGVE